MKNPCQLKENKLNWRHMRERERAERAAPHQQGFYSNTQLRPTPTRPTHADSVLISMLEYYYKYEITLHYKYAKYMMRKSFHVNKLLQCNRPVNISQANIMSRINIYCLVIILIPFAKNSFCFLLISGRIHENIWDDIKVWNVSVTVWVCHTNCAPD